MTPFLASNQEREVSLESIVNFVCCQLGTTIDEIRSDKRSQKLVQARSAMASLTQKLKAGTMADLARHILRDPTSLAKLARKGQSDVAWQSFTDELFTTMIAEEIP